MSKYYEINFKRLALLLLPTFWRKPVLATLAYATVSPFSYLHTRFVLFRRESDYRLTHNGQVCHLRAVLNDRFDPIARRLTVTDDADSTGVLLLHEREREIFALLPARDTGRAIIINRRGFGGTSGLDFWVNIPLVLYDTVDVTRLKAIVDGYKLASKRFSINYN